MGSSLRERVIWRGNKVGERYIEVGETRRKRKEEREEGERGREMDLEGEID